MTAMSTPVEIRWRRFWGVSTRATSVAGAARSTVSTLIPDLPREPAQAPEFARGLRNGTILVTSAGAATNNTMSACNTVVRVSGVWAMLCIAKPPACSAPNSKPASTMPSGLDRPRSATVIASNPIEPTIPSVSGTGTPEAVGPKAA